MKVKVQHLIVVELHAVGTVEFKTEFLSRVSEEAEKIVQKYGALEHNLDLGAKCIAVEAKGIPIKDVGAFRDEVVQSVVLLAEHGPDSDVLNTLLDRYPQLRAHPNLPALVNSFENMTDVLQGLLGEQSGEVVAEIVKRQKEGVTLIEEDLAATPGRRSAGMSADDRAKFREAAILGKTPEQVEAMKQVPQNSPSPLPDVYGKDKDGYGKMPGDEGNVFARPSKGSSS